MMMLAQQVPLFPENEFSLNDLMLEVESMDLYNTPIDQRKIELTALGWASIRREMIRDHHWDMGCDPADIARSGTTRLVGTFMGVAIYVRF